MTLNMGTVDRVLRIALAVVVAILIILGKLTGVAAIILGIFAIVFLITSAVGFCPLYKLLGISTKKG